MTEAQKKAKKAYREKLSRILVEFYPKETGLFLHLKKKKNKQGYIKDLIRQDMAKKHKKGCKCATGAKMP